MARPSYLQLRLSPFIVAAMPPTALATWFACATNRSEMIGSWSIVMGVSLVAAAWLVPLLRRERHESAVARRYLELLGQAHQAPLGTYLGTGSLPLISANSVWHAPLTQVRDVLAAQQQRQDDWATTRAALEVRLQSKSGQLELMAVVLAKLNEPVFVVDAYDELVLANAEADRRLGVKEKKKSRLADLLPNDRLASMIADVRRRTAATRRSDEVELTNVDGSKHWYRATVENLCGGDTLGNGGAALVVLRDVGNERDAQRRHAEFVSAASHEMKTPLAGIRAYVELLADGEARDDDERDEFLGVINTQADRLQRLIENLLNIARIEAGVVKVSKQSHSVNEILNESLHVVGPSAEAKQISLVADLSPLYLGALVDRDMLSQAVINLLSNAVKYTPSGGRVTLRSRLSDHEIQIEVEDTGVGLSEEDCHRVFEKFYRVEKDKSMAPGTGLGLALAQHITEDVHGGRLTVRSKLGEGSTFSIVIPSAGRSA